MSFRGEIGRKSRILLQNSQNLRGLVEILACMGEADFESRKPHIPRALPDFDHTAPFLTVLVGHGLKAPQLYA